MSDKINNGKGFLKEKMGGYQVDPPSSVWNTISTRMGGRKRKGLVIIALAAAASVALAVTLGINYFSQDLSRDQEIAEISDQSPRPASQTVTQPEPNVDIADQESANPRGRVTLEEKVVRTLEAVATETGETTDPELAGQGSQEEEFPFDIGTPSISEIMKSNQDTRTVQSGQAAETEKTSLELTDETRETSLELTDETQETSLALTDETQETSLALTDEPAEDLTLDAGNPVDGETMLDFEEQPVRDPRWMVGAALSPLYTFRDAEQQVMAVAPDHESGTVSYAGGIQVGYRTTRRLAIETGVFYNKMGISIGAPGIQLFSQEFDFSPLEGEAERSSVMAISNSVGNIVSKSGDIYVNSYKLNASNQIDAVTGSFASEVNADQGIRQHLDYLEFPFNLRYTLVDRGLKVQLVGGMSTNLLVNNYVTMESEDGPTEIGYLTNIRNVNYSGNAGIGLAYHFLEHFSVNLEPRFRYFLNSVNDATLPSTRPYTFGLYTGMSYIF